MLWHRFQEPYAADPVPAAPLCLPLRVPNFSKRLLSVTSSFTQVCTSPLSRSSLSSPPSQVSLFEGEKLRAVDTAHLDSDVGV